MKLIVTLNEKASPGIWPDITFLIDCAVEIGLERALKRNEIQFQEGQDRFEREKKDFHEAVRKGYLHMAMEDRERFVVVDGILKEDELEEIIFKHVEPFISQ